MISTMNLFCNECIVKYHTEILDLGQKLFHNMLNIWKTQSLTLKVWLWSFILIQLFCFKLFLKWIKIISVKQSLKSKSKLMNYRVAATPGNFLKLLETHRIRFTPGKWLLETGKWEILLGNYWNFYFISSVAQVIFSLLFRFRRIWI